MTPTMKATLKWVHKVSAGPSAVSFAMGGFCVEAQERELPPHDDVGGEGPLQ